MRVDRAWIAAHIPHRGAMCLIDEVLDWQSGFIECATSTHLARHHPLRAHGRLGVACGIEYAAQAMAIHGALTGSAPIDDAVIGSGADTPAGTANTAAANMAAAPRAGMLAGVRGVRAHVARLDDLPGPLICRATQLAGEAGSALYEFSLTCESRPVISGRATVVFDAGPLLAMRST